MLMHRLMLKLEIKGPAVTVSGPHGSIQLKECSQAPQYCASMQKTNNSFCLSGTLAGQSKVCTPDLQHLPQQMALPAIACPMQVTAVFARRGYNVQSLAVGPSEAPGCSRIVMVVPGGPAGTTNIQRQLLKLIYVQKVRLPRAWQTRCMLSPPGLCGL